MTKIRNNYHYFLNHQFRILCEIIINWSNKNENDHLWNEVIFLLLHTFMEFAANWYRKCCIFNKFQNTREELAGPFMSLPSMSAHNLDLTLSLFFCRFLDILLGVSVHSMSALVQMMALCRSGDKLLSEQTTAWVTDVQTHAARHQCVNKYSHPSLMWYLHVWNARDVLHKLSAISLEYFSSLAEIGGSLFWHLSSLVVLCIVVTAYGATGDDGIVGLTTFCFQCSTNKIFTPHYSCSLTEMYTCFIMLGQFFYHIIIVSFFFLLKVGDRQLDGFVVADGTVSCHDDLLCHWWWQAWSSFVLGAKNRASIALFMC